MWPSSLHSLELGGAHFPCPSAAIFSGCLWHSWAPGLPESSCRHLLLILVKSSSLAFSEHVPLALCFLAHPKMWVYAEGLPSGVSSSEASLQLLPCGWLVPQPHILAVSRAHLVAPCVEVQLLIPTRMSLQWDPWCCPKTHHHWQIQ